MDDRSVKNKRSYKKKVQNVKRGRGNPAPTIAVARFLNMSQHKMCSGYGGKNMPTTSW